MGGAGSVRFCALSRVLDLWNSSLRLVRRSGFFSSGGTPKNGISAFLLIFLEATSAIVSKA